MGCGNHLNPKMEPREHPPIWSQSKTAGCGTSIFRVIERPQLISSEFKKEVRMADRVVIIRWDKPVVGREQQALMVFQKAIEYYMKWQTEGRIESFEPVILAHHSGDLNGFMMLRGDAKKLAELKLEESWADLVIESGFCLEGFGIIEGFIGDGMMKVFEKYTKLIG
jgi:hypothetical protein